MKFSEQWLREWVNPPVNTEELAEQMTLMGLEVDDIESVNPGLEGVVVGKLVEVSAHPDADKLRVCRVDAGAAEPLQIVCGAPNARVGLVAPLATIGARLPGGIKIKKSKLRGVESQGMLCSARELTLSDDDVGLMELDESLVPGERIDSVFDLDDNILEVELTPNRGDCLCIRGIARDLSARNACDLQLHEITAVAPTIDDTMDVKVASDSACARYAGRIVRGVDCTAKSPTWMVERLRRGGVRSINPAVDVTNYVMLELGQPMHAFDMEKLQGNIGVRRASDGEKVKLLDGRDVKLEADTTVIVDDRGAIGIAGIMGGDSTGVEDATTDIFLESALFLPLDIIGKPRRYDAHTESAHRYERGVDPSLQAEAMEYATSLLMTIAGGEPGPVVDWVEKDRLPFGDPLVLRRARIEKLLGISFDDAQVNSILGRLGITLEPHAEGWTVTPPSYRYDLRIEEDYVEELARVHGFDNIPRTYNGYQPVFKPVEETSVNLNTLKEVLVHRGYREVVTFSFVDDAVQHALMPDVDALMLANPISNDLAAMRCSLAPGLLGALERNVNRQVPDLRLFETGLRFVPQDDDLIQENVIGGLISGRRNSESWNHTTEQLDFYDLKGDVEELLAASTANEYEFVAGSVPFLHPGQSADIICRDENIGWFGQIHPKLQKSLDLSQTSLLFEIRLDALREARVPSYRDISRFPSVRRDLSLLTPETTTNRALEKCVEAHAPAALQKVVTFDVYSGDKIDAGMKSVALGLILQDFSRTLEEAEVDQAVDAIVGGLLDDLGVRLRA